MPAISQTFFQNISAFSGILTLGSFKMLYWSGPHSMEGWVKIHTKHVVDECYVAQGDLSQRVQQRCCTNLKAKAKDAIHACVFLVASTDEIAAL